MKDIIEKSNEKIIKDKGKIVETDAYVYRAQKFNQNVRGNKFNYVYIDSRLSNEDKNQIIMSLCPSPNLLPEELDHWYWRSFISYY